MHESFLQRGKEGPIGVLFLGDSITQFWADKGKETWDARYAKLNAANFGISGDRTQWLLWRIANGELDGISPKVVVLLMGTNNTAANTADEIAAGDAKIVEQIRAKLPETKIILLAIFPRGPREPTISAEKTEAYMKIHRAANERLAKLDDGKTVRFLDLGPKLAPGGGFPSKEVMPDGVHPGPRAIKSGLTACSPC
jgi:lysophospholipase L1-like esterase